jgi:hypothetical protein
VRQRRISRRFSLPVAPPEPRNASTPIDLPDAESARVVLAQLRQSGRIAYIRDEIPTRVELTD